MKDPSPYQYKFLFRFRLHDVTGLPAGFRVSIRLTHGRLTMESPTVIVDSNGRADFGGYSLRFPCTMYRDLTNHDGGEVSFIHKESLLTIFSHAATDSSRPHTNPPDPGALAYAWCRVDLDRYARERGMQSDQTLPMVCGTRVQDSPRVFLSGNGRESNEVSLVEPAVRRMVAAGVTIIGIWLRDQDKYGDDADLDSIDAFHDSVQAILKSEFERVEADLESMTARADRQANELQKLHAQVGSLEEQLAVQGNQAEKATRFREALCRLVDAPPSASFDQLLKLIRVHVESRAHESSQDDVITKQGKELVELTKQMDALRTYHSQAMEELRMENAKLVMELRDEKLRTQCARGTNPLPENMGPALSMGGVGSLWSHRVSEGVQTDWMEIGGVSAGPASSQGSVAKIQMLESAVRDLQADNVRLLKANRDMTQRRDVECTAQQDVPGGYSCIHAHRLEVLQRELESTQKLCRHLENIDHTKVTPQSEIVKVKHLEEELRATKRDLEKMRIRAESANRAIPGKEPITDVSSAARYMSMFSARKEHGEKNAVVSKQSPEGEDGAMRLQMEVVDLQYNVQELTVKNESLAKRLAEVLGTGEADGNSEGPLTDVRSRTELKRLREQVESLTAENKSLVAANQSLCRLHDLLRELPKAAVLLESYAKKPALGPPPSKPPGKKQLRPYQGEGISLTDSDSDDSASHNKDGTVETVGREISLRELASHAEDVVKALQLEVYRMNERNEKLGEGRATAGNGLNVRLEATSAPTSPKSLGKEHARQSPPRAHPPEYREKGYGGPVFDDGVEHSLLQVTQQRLGEAEKTVQELVEENARLSHRIVSLRSQLELKMEDPELLDKLEAMLTAMSDAQLKLIRNWIIDIVSKRRRHVSRCCSAAEKLQHYKEDSRKNKSVRDHLLVKKKRQEEEDEDELVRMTRKVLPAHRVNASVDRLAKPSQNRLYGK